MVEDGWTVQRIMETIGTTRKVVRRWLAEQGIPEPPPFRFPDAPPSVCITCGETKPIESFYRSNRRLRKRCRECFETAHARTNDGAPWTREEVDALMDAPHSNGETPRQRFLARVRIDETGCHLWTGSLDKLGYGMFTLTVGGRPRSMHAHRLRWIMEHGWIGDKHIQVCHDCDVRACVNIGHLWLGTQADNTADMYEKGRGNHGERNGRAVLTPEIVLEIRRSNVLDSAWAQKLGVNQSTIRSARLGLKWKHLPMPRSESV